jgi:hypothetical protein
MFKRCKRLLRIQRLRFKTYGDFPIFSTSTATISIVAVFCFMPYCIYIIYSEKAYRYYVGATESLEGRFAPHNAGRNKSTKAGFPGN